MRGAGLLALVLPCLVRETLSSEAAACGSPEASLPSLQVHELEQMWGEAAAYLKEEHAAGRHPMLDEMPWRLRPILSPPFLSDELLSASVIEVPAVDNGLFANVLQLLDAALIAEAISASLSINWTRKASNKAFSYGPPGQDIFRGLFLRGLSFGQLEDSADEERVQINNRINPLLLAPSRGKYFKAPFFERHRRIMASTFARTFVLQPELREELSALTSRFDTVRAAGGRVIGLHCRLTMPEMSDAQSVGVTSCSGDELLAFLRLEVGRNDLLFVATDSAADAAALRGAFGRSCVMQEDVPRGYLGAAMEPHARAGGGTLRDGQLVVLDAWALSMCDLLLHNSESNIVLAAAFINPDMRLQYMSSGSPRAHGEATKSLLSRLDQRSLKPSMPGTAPPAPPTEWALLEYEASSREINAFMKVNSDSREWTLVKPAHFMYEPADLTLMLHGWQQGIERVDSIIIKALRRDGSVFPEVSELSKGIMDPQLVCLVRTRLLRNAITISSGAGRGSVVKNAVKTSLVDASKWKNLRISHEAPLAYDSELVGSATGGTKGKPAPPPRPSSLTDSEDLFDPEAERRVMGEEMLPLIRAMADGIHDSGSFEERAFLMRGTMPLRFLLPPELLLNGVDWRASYEQTPETTRNRLVVPPLKDLAENDAGHRVEFYAGGFAGKAKMYERVGVRKDGTFTAATVRDALQRGDTVVWQRAHAWSPGAAAVADAMHDTFRMRASVNAYLSSQGAHFSAHNDPHCFTVFQLSGTKRWRVWLNSTRMLSEIDSVMGASVPAAAQRFGLDGKMHTENDEDVQALGPPDMDVQLRSGDLLYVPRGAIHLTSTSAGDNGDPSLHFTCAMPLDFQSLSVALGLVQEKPLNPTHLQTSLQQAARQLAARDVDFRRTRRPLATQSNEQIKEKLRSELHAIVDEMIDETSYAALARAALERGLRRALDIPRRIDPNIPHQEWRANTTMSP